MKILVTGGAGFVGRHLVASLQEKFGNAAAIILTSKSGGADISGISAQSLDITDSGAVSSALESVRPTHVIHLAGLAAVQSAAASPTDAWQTHVFGTINLAESILATVPDCSLIYASSGLVYGSTARCDASLTEAALLAPNNDYALTKAAADLALGSYAGRGLRCVRLRPFNHTGPGQSEDFAIPSFAMQIARIEAGQMPPVLKVGNLDAQRDFLDVRDVTAAYAEVVSHSNSLEPGTILNIASGIPRRIGDALHRLIEFSGIAITVEQDAGRMRPSDIPKFVGNSELAKRRLGWKSRIPFDQTLRDVLDFSRAEVRSRPKTT
jgi:GDP-4-dehydro-6-deoxy-D-mannose reductase